MVKYQNVFSRAIFVVHGESAVERMKSLPSWVRIFTEPQPWVGV